MEMAVREAHIHLRGPVAAQLTTQRALDHQIASGELLSAGWDAVGAFLARHHVDGWLDRSLLAVVHCHGRRIGERYKPVIHRL